ncbi:hypothetical protein G4X40_17390 [Rhodococcus sp. D2-41]|uniref:Cardiolipin synthase N-terminal domain-containing protein n=1 Tax=Speluncibacter jeojiensis TaxID=2710754 RepID=A0A9X4RCB5_9ACTN|nr:hypothetical protein [Rhodococcus sp. D2-41]MDG3011918.1 hypothetical protein [Rhodococcus sp. D2-41]MDG3013369.1 hypothetical protein [Corynebacteriales bacterium D3-21]
MVKKWSELGPRTRQVVIALGVVEMVLLLAAQIDISRRTAEEVRGSKRMWRALSFVNIIGPVAYFVRGRRRD